MSGKHLGTDKGKGPVVPQWDHFMSTYGPTERPGTGGPRVPSPHRGRGLFHVFTCDRVTTGTVAADVLIFGDKWLSVLLANWRRGSLL